MGYRSPVLTKFMPVSYSVTEQNLFTSVPTNLFVCDAQFFRDPHQAQKTCCPPGAAVTGAAVDPVSFIADGGSV